VAAVILIINPVMVIPVADALENAVAPDPVMVYVPDPVMDLVSVPVLANVALVTENVEQSSEPCVSVRAPLAVSASAKVAIPVVLTINAGSVLPLLVIVPVPTRVGVKVVYVPLDDNVKLPAMLNAVVPGLNAVVPKFNVLNQLAVVSVAIEAPVVNVKLGAIVAEPPDVLPTENVLVLLISATVNPPVPVKENPPSAAMFNTTVAAVVCVRLMLPALALPNAIARIPAPVELNIPVFTVTPSASVSVPAVSV